MSLMSPRRAAAPMPEMPREQAGKLIGALDFGASKIACLIARYDGTELKIVGVGLAKPQIGPNGTPLDFDACVRAIRIAVDQAERMAGETISSVIASFGGKGLSSRQVIGQAALPPGPITPKAVRAALAAGLEHGPGAGKVVLHATPLGYRIDESALVADPRGREGKNLTAQMTLVTAPEAAVAALVDCITEAGLRTSRVVASPYAAGLAILSPEERAIGSVALDCGAGHVGIAAFTGGHLVLADSGPIGGAALTQDIAQRLGATYAAAERVKLAHGGFSHAPPAEIPVEAPSLGADGRLEARVVSRGSIIEAMGPRLEEMLAAVRARLTPVMDREGQKPWRAALTGGGAQLSGLRDLAEAMLNRPMRMGRPVGFGPLDQGAQAYVFAVAAGLLRFEIDPPAEAIGAPEAAASTPAPKLHLPPMSSKVGSAMGKAWGWLRENF